MGVVRLLAPHYGWACVPVPCVAVTCVAVTCVAVRVSLRWWCAPRRGRARHWAWGSVGCVARVVNIHYKAFAHGMATHVRSRCLCWGIVCCSRRVAGILCYARRVTGIVCCGRRVTGLFRDSDVSYRRRIRMGQGIPGDGAHPVSFPRKAGEEAVHCKRKGVYWAVEGMDMGRNWQPMNMAAPSVLVYSKGDFLNGGFCLFIDEKMAPVSGTYRPLPN